ncbi:P27 family phage terminase small subunit [Mycobacterium sp. KBS0706]|uniref:P27 family phage terminase small subunit n=1 Tax=Mycobacterium sp. KBS0706 TaxID=2578109 RepID=UPI00110F965F|nr:P27 family phage terminase small subunit [Mycobacterium sp. KBS0706]TSD88036.1 P27 family phage terminase small subunit [Mycobacterium sp. KBS0706]
MRGPRPKPTAIRRLEGTRSHKKQNHHEPQGRPGIPAPPEDIGPAELRVWVRLGASLAAQGLLGIDDGPAYGALVELVARLDTVRDRLRQIEAQDGAAAALTAATAHGGTMVHPLQAEWRRLNAAVQRAYSEWGMTPSGRTRVEARKADPVPPDSKYYGLLGGDDGADLPDEDSDPCTASPAPAKH